MIGDLIKPPRTPEEKARVRLYRKPLYKKKWFRRLFCLFALALVVGVLALLIILKPHRDKALTFNLEEMRELEQASIIYDRNRAEIGRIFVQNRQPVALADVPHHLVEALVAAEDSRFFKHSGVDFMGIARAMLINLKSGGYTQGASTITQQLARNAFGLTGKSIERKLTEAFLAHRIEQHYSKTEILELYLNRIYLGSGFYGIEAASRGYFGKSARELTRDEAATICGLIKSPNRLSPLNDREAAIRERNYVLARMRDEKMISTEEYNDFVGRPLKLSPSVAHLNTSYEYEQVRQRVIDRLGFEQASVGGFRIFTTIDRSIQTAAEESLQKHLTAFEENTKGYGHQTYAEYERTFARYEKSREDGAEPPPPKYVQGAVLMIDNLTGGVIAIVGGRDYRHNEYNRAIQARRPAGTAFTPFVFAAAFEKGMFPGSQLPDSPLDNRMVMIGGTTGVLGEWGAEGPTNYEGDVSAREALVNGKNAATVRLGLDVGLEVVKAFAVRAGILSPLREYPSTFLGASEVTLEEMCLGFTIFPNLGKRPPRIHIVSSIQDATGRQIYTWTPEESPPVAVTDPLSAYQVHSCLEQALAEGTGALAYQEYGLKPKAAAKTGTHYDFTDLWTVGYHSRITCGVWAGFDLPQEIARGAFSSRVVLPIWTEVMNAAEANFPGGDIEPPDGEWMEICTKSGLRATEHCYEQEAAADGQSRWVRCTFRELVRKGNSMGRYCTLHAEGRAASTDLTQILAQASKPPPEQAADNAEPIAVLSPTVLGNDPYRSDTPILRARPVHEEDEDIARPAQVVYPTKMGSDKYRIDLPPPPPLKVE